MNNAINSISRFGLIMFIVAILFQSNSIFGQPTGFSVTDYSTGFDSPVGMTFDQSGRMMVWERSGRVWVVNSNGQKQAQPLIDIREEIYDYWDHGLLGFALDPNFLSNGYFYLLYVVDRHHLMNFGTANYNPNTTVTGQASIARITRYRATQASNFSLADMSSRKILVGESPSTGIPISSPAHGIGALAFGTDGSLMASCGDAGQLGGIGSHSGDYWQQAINDGILRPDENVGSYRSAMINSLNGKIMRIDPNTGDGLSSNPFYQSNSPRSPQSRVFHYGLRNPFRFTVKPNSGSHNSIDGNPGELYIGDVGWLDREEINVATTKGLNFGWPNYEGIYKTPNTYGNPTYEPVSHALPTIDYRDNSVRVRVNGQIFNVGSAQFPGTLFSGACSVGGIWYNGTNFPPEYRNTYFHADCAGNWIRNIKFDANNNPVSINSFLNNAGSTVTALSVNPVNGALYVCDLGGGKVRKIEYTGFSNLEPVSKITYDKNFGNSPLTVNLSSKNSYDPDNGTLTYLWTFGDGTTSTQPNPIKTFSSGGLTSYEVKLKVTDPNNSSNESSVNVSLNNTPPKIISTSLDNISFFTNESGLHVPLNAVAIDDEQNSNQLTYEWKTALYHNEHFHSNPPVGGANNIFIISEVPCDSLSSYWYRIELKVTDGGGLSSTFVKDLMPNCGKPQSQTLTFPPISDKTTTSTSFNLNATTTSGLPPVFYLVSGPATLLGSTVTLSGKAGVVTVVASQPGNSTYNPAISVIRSFRVNNEIDNIAPTPPSNLSPVNQTPNSVGVTWSPSFDAFGVAGYQVFKDNVLVETTSNTFYQFNGLSSNLNFTVTIKAYDASGNISQSSTPLAVVFGPPDIEAPSIPINLTALEVLRNRINLGWSPSTDNNSVSGYDAFLNGVIVNNTTITSTQFLYEGLIPNTTYQLSVRAKDASGNVSLQSSVLSITTLPPDTQAPSVPANLVASNITTTSATISWTASTDNDQVKGYNIFQNNVKVNTSLITTLSYNLTGLVNSTTYGISISAVDISDNESEKSSSLAITTLAPPPLPTPLVELLFNENSLNSISNTGSAGSIFTKTATTPNWTTNSVSGASALDFGTTVGNFVVESSANIPQLAGLNSFTITGWLNNKSTAIGSGGNRIVSWINNGGDGVDLVYRSDGSLALSVDEWPDPLPGSTAGKIPTIASAPATNWTFFAVSYDASAGQVKYYFGTKAINAAIDVTNNYNNGPVNNNISRLAVGHFNIATRSAALDRMFRGLIDEIRVYGVALSPSEVVLVQQLSTNIDTQAPTQPTNLVASNVTMNSMTISWIASTDNIGVASYDIFRNGVKINASPITTTSFQVNGLSIGTNYIFTVIAKDGAANTSIESLPLNTSTLFDTQAPTIPTNLVASNITTTSATISWSASTDNVGVAGYDVYRNGTKINVSPVTSLTYTATGLQSGVTYLFAVTAFDIAGNTSAKSNNLSVTTLAPDTQAPSVPTNLVASNITTTSATISWSASTDNVGMAGYDVYRDGIKINVSPVTSLTYSATGLQTGTTYLFTVVAFDIAGNTSAQSNNLSVTTLAPDTQAPSVPTNLVASNITTNSATISWSASTDNDQVKGYNIFQNNVKVNSALITTLSYNLTGLVNSTTYGISISAVDISDNESEKSSSLAITTLAPPPLPTPLVELLFNENSLNSISNTGSAGSIFTKTATTPNWTTNSVSGASALDFGTTVGNFVVESSANIPQLAGLNSFTITGWLNNKSTAIGSGGNRIVSWINNGGDGVDLVYRSNGSLALSVDEWPDPLPGSTAGKIPTNASAPATNWTFFAVSYDASAGQVKYYFGTKAINAAIDVTNNYNNGPVNNNISRLAVGHFNIATRSGALDRMFRGLIDEIRVYGVALTPSEVVLVQQLSTNIDTQAPTQPTNLVASNVTMNSMTISWTASTDNIGVASYDIFRNGVKINAAPITTTSFQVNGLSIGTNYIFTVIAKDGAANTSIESLPLNASTLSDTQAPTIPTNLAASNITATSATISWSASTDNVGVAGYDLYRDGIKINLSPVTSLTYSATGLQSGVTYLFTVVAFDIAGNTSAQSNNLSVTTLAPDTQAPSVPTNLVASNITTTSATISWSASTDNVGVAGYDVYRNGTKMNVNPVTSLTYSTTGLQSGVTYLFTVVAFDIAGNTSAQSNNLSVTTLVPDTQAPSVPTNLVASNITTTSATISWSASTDNVGVAGYNVYRNGTKINVSPVTSLTYSATGLQSGVTYLFTVVAFDASGNTSAQSSILSITTQILSGPVPLIKLNFNENSGNQITNFGSVGGTLTKTNTPSWSPSVPANVGGLSSLNFGTSVGNFYVESSTPISQLAGLTSFTITGWLNNRSSTIGSGGNRIVSWINNGGNGVDLVYRSNGSLAVSVDQWPDNLVGSNTGKITTNTNSTIQASNWTFFAVSYNSSIGQVKYYFGTNSNNATLDKIVNYNRGVVDANISRLAIGNFNIASRSLAGLDRMFRGLIDEIQIFGTELNQSSIVNVQRGITSNLISVQKNEFSVDDSRQLIVSPNPTNDLFDLNFISSKNGKGILKYINNLGSVVKEESIEILDGLNVKTISSAYLNNGVYHVILEIDGEFLNGKVVVLK